MDYFVGLDVSLRSVAVCVIDGDGRTVLERTVACEIDDISGCLASLKLNAKNHFGGADEQSSKAGHYMEQTT